MEEVAKEVFETFAKAQRNMEKMFREIWDKFSKYPVSPGIFEPPIDIEDRGDELVMYVDLPGFSKNEIRIKVTEDMVEVNAKKSSERVESEKSRRYFVHERVYEGFHKTVSLPVKVRPEQARAKLENGVLEVYLPKSEAAREIEVSVE